MNDELRERGDLKLENKCYMITRQYLDKLTYEIIGAAIEVHKHLGPGLLESVYHACMVEEMSSRSIYCQTEVPVSVRYKSIKLDVRLRCDLIVEDCIVVEFKAIREMTNIDRAQLLTYMNLLKKPKGILINFNCSNVFKEGQITLVNEYYNQLF